MQIKTLATSLFASCALTAGLDAQAIAGSFSPNPAELGDVITFTGTDSRGFGFFLGTPCSWHLVHQGTQDGPLIDIVQGCGQIVVPVAPSGSHSITWDQMDFHGNAVPPGKYWFEIKSGSGLDGSLRVDWFCLEIRTAASDPALRQASPAQVGAVVPLEIEAPDDPFALYRVVASFTSNNPLRALGLDFCVSPDPLLLWSLLQPSSLFTEGIGILDGAGKSTGLAVNIPNNPALAYQGFHLQAVLITASGSVLTNDLSLTILP